MFLSNLKNKKEVISWSLYDFANQPFTTIIVTFVYGAFFTEYIANDKQTGTLLWSSAIAVTAVVVSVLSPILGALADKGGYRKLFLMFFTWVCAIFSILLYFPEEGDVYFALSLFVVANVAFEMGSVFCNSYLPDLSEKDNIGKISGFGWGLGFVGGLSALFLSLHLFPTLDSEGIRRINILVGVWFLIFSIPTFLFVKDRKSEKLQKRHIINSFKSLKNTFNEVVKYKIILKFLVARLFFNDGLVTIFSLGGIYAMGTLNFSFDEVLILGIVLNVAAGVGSFVFGYLEDEIGVKNVINISLLVLIFSTLLAYFAPETSNPKQMFWVAGVFIGLMVGPNQSCSRSLMAQLTPKEKQNEFFGFFALTGKATSFLGPLLFGIIAKFYSQQLALWVVILFFIIGLFLFNRINFKQE
jgi:UMF1 family MFS transporter